MCTFFVKTKKGFLRYLAYFESDLQPLAFLHRILAQVFSHIQNIMPMFPVPGICLMECTQPIPKRGKDKKNESCLGSTQVQVGGKKKQKANKPAIPSLVRVS